MGSSSSAADGVAVVEASPGRREGVGREEGEVGTGETEAEEGVGEACS